MTNTKTKKRALYASVLSLFLCITMLIGSTFAWFTDSAIIGVNNIVAGTLEIELYSNETCTEKADILTFKKAAGHEKEPILFEPGARYELTQVWLKNDGNLHAKYQVIISGVSGNNKLAEVLDVIIDGQTVGTLKDLLATSGIVKEHHIAAGEVQTFGKIELMMQTTAGNDYQDKTIDGITITVLATQYMAENDSYGNQYDNGAQYPDFVYKWDGTIGEVPAPSDDPATEEVVEQNIIVINTPEELAGFAAAVNAGNNYAGYTVKLGDDIDLNNKEWTSIGLTKDTAFAGAFDGNNHTISNLLMSKSSREDGYYAGLFAHSKMNEIKNLTIHNANVSGGNMSAVLIARQHASIDVSNIKFTGDVYLTITNSEGGLVVANGSVKSISDVTVDVSDNSYVKCLTTSTRYWEYLGGLWGHVWPTKATNIYSNIDVYGYASSIGGIGGGCAVTSDNIVCDGNVTIAIDDTEKDSGYDCSLRTGLIYGFGVGSANAATHKNCSATGTLTVGGKVITSMENTDDINTAEALWSNGYQKNDIRFGAPYYATGVITIEN